MLFFCKLDLYILVFRQNFYCGLFVHGLKKKPQLALENEMLSSKDSLSFSFVWYTEYSPENI